MGKDRRIRRTQKLLGEALIALVLEEGFKNITIQDVTDRADIGYRTYFRHYSGLEELAIDVAQAKLDEIYEVLELRSLEDVSTPLAAISQNGKAIFEYIQANEKILCILLLDSDLRFILEPIMKIAREKTETILEKIPNPSLPPPIAANHIIVAVFGLMRWWFENEKPHPSEEMGEIFARLIIQPTWSALTSD